ncbi:sugar ABC transporter substrate-binding protein [Actinoplanes friuliensis]|jgi:multiple sugar transport system substrate-binding protein|uniref:Putative sugar ABC transporter substrate binding protein n=1 Tax=Actinoplanes friuliensis DSM 7358 TaxID=1246995 RepID=U5W3F0_9ACTN|nr:sugar ABC transporter substrate-binding protein [Actinoplanes friuliensis]AGZ43733.1 putative sugar ABC transporter substrate binding protein [Actinoplanes friuliensis DSM 7358]
MHRPVLATLMIVPLVLAAAACGGGGSDDSGDSGTLRVLDYYNNEPDKTVYQQALEKCGQQNGVTIERETVPGANLIAKVLQQSSSRTLPDVLMIDNPDLQQIAATGALAPVTDFGLSADGYAKGVVDASTYQGKLFGLQPVTNTIGLFYNKDLLAEAGVQPPTTWAELRTAAKTLTKGDRYGVAFSAPANYEGTWQFLPFMWSNGGDEKNIATPQVAQALQLWVDLLGDKSASRSVLNWTQADVNDQFKAGKAAMMVNGPWQFPVLNEDTKLHYDVVPIPAPQAGGTVVAPLGGETWTIPQTGSKDRQAKAAKVVGCLNADDSQLSLGKLRQTVPTKTALGEQFVAANPSMKAFTTAVQTARARTGELGADWPKAATKIYTGVQTALTGGAAPQQALQQAQNG